MKNTKIEQMKATQMNEGKISEFMHAEGLNYESQMTGACSGCMRCTSVQFSRR